MTKWMRIAGASLRYFGVVFGVGFVLGTVRALLLVPRVGDRVAELVEAPLMAAAIVLASLWSVRCERLTPKEWLVAGVVAAACVLVADVVVGVMLRGMTLRQVFLERDAVAGPVYYALVAWFAVAPWLVARRRKGPTA
jgi:hypothetical protein